jgi:hypothetical protein
VQVADGAEVRGAASLIQGAIDTYRASVEFYDGLADRVPRIADQLRQPAEDEVVALLVSDRHDNIGMDATVAAVAAAGDASFLIDAGDDTSSGASWETFSIDSLAEAADDMEVVAVPGNHDQGDTVGTRMKERGFTVLHGKPTQVAGSSSWVTQTHEAAATPRSAGPGRRPSPSRPTGWLTSPAKRVTSARWWCTTPTPAGGCRARLCRPGAVRPPAPAGGSHRSDRRDGSVATTYTNGTTGGAAFSIALGSKLRRPAQMTLVTYADQTPVACNRSTSPPADVRGHRARDPSEALSAQHPPAAGGATDAT